MSTVKSSADHLTLNADGASKDIKFQANGVEKASISSAGAFTSTSIDATKLTGALPAIDGSALTSLTSSQMPAGSVLQAQITGYTSSSATVVNGGSATLMTITITVRANSKVMMWFDSHQTGLSGTNVNPNVTFAMDGSVISPDTNHYFYQSGGRTVIHKIFLTGALSAGSHTFTVVGGSYNGSVTYNYQDRNGGRFMLQEIAG